MEEQTNPKPMESAEIVIPAAPETVSAFRAGKEELLFALLILMVSILLCNTVYSGGFRLGFALTAVIALCISAGYLKRSGRKFDWYSGSLLVLSLIIAGGFGRSGDAFVKFVMFHFLLVGANLSFCIAAGQNRRSPNGAASLLDAPRAVFKLGMGSMGPAAKGLTEGIQHGGETTRKFGSVAMGLLISVPVLAVMTGLLMDADAAFQGLMDLLPRGDVEEYLISGLWGFFLGWLLYSRGVALHRGSKPREEKKIRRGLQALTVNTVLCAVCVLYLVYLLSQLAYLSGGFAGILPEGFTMAEYARRGFFEMATLCGVNLTVICGCVWLVEKHNGVPGLTKLCGAFIGGVTVFLVGTASAKMLLYIESYGLTRLRVLTEVITLWLGLTTLFVTVWLFRPKLPYMKAVVLSAMIVGAAVLWVDVDSMVAKYNVESYQSGKLETVDLQYMRSLNVSAVPYIQELTEDEDPAVAGEARQLLITYARWYPENDDWRDWTWASARAQEILEQYRED